VRRQRVMEGIKVELIDNLIYTLETLSSALSARNKNKALETIALLSQQFTATFGRATRIFLAILFIETLKVHILCEEFEEAQGGASALLGRLKAVNAAIQRASPQAVPTSFDASAEDVLDDVINAETAPGDLLPTAAGGKQQAETAGAGAPEPKNLLAAYPHLKLIPVRPKRRLLALVGCP
jgi:hypothetical protein